jgi:co-chaperonin GroES (HSP10)
LNDWQPLYDKLIVRRHPAPTHLAGLEVPEAHREKQNVGTVVKAGIGRHTPPYVVNDTGYVNEVRFVTQLLINVGDEVLFNKFAGVQLEEDDPNLVVLREDEILAYRKPDV